MQEQIDLARPGAISGGGLGGFKRGRPALGAMGLSADGADLRDCASSASIAANNFSAAR